MAKLEGEGYRLDSSLDFSSDNRLYGLWSLIEWQVVYEEEDKSQSPDTATWSQAFSTDPISYDVLSTIVRVNVNANKILVHQPRIHSYNSQATVDIGMKFRELPYSHLIVHAGSNFVVIINNEKDDIDVWVWDLRICL